MLRVGAMRASKFAPCLADGAGRATICAASSRDGLTSDRDFPLMQSTITVRVPASTSNLGPGFDCLGIALQLYNDVTVFEVAPLASRR